MTVSQLPRSVKARIIRAYVLGAPLAEIGAEFNIRGGYATDLVRHSAYHDCVTDGRFQKLDRLGRLTYRVLREDGVDHPTATRCARQEMAWRQERKAENETCRYRKGK